jgi:hypothetical protein
MAAESTPTEPRTRPSTAARARTMGKMVWRPFQAMKAAWEVALSSIVLARTRPGKVPWTRSAVRLTRSIMPFITTPFLSMTLAG